jgi:hypothetical protein
MWILLRLSKMCEGSGLMVLRHYKELIEEICNVLFGGEPEQLVPGLRLLAFFGKAGFDVPSDQYRNLFQLLAHREELVCRSAFKTLKVLIGNVPAVVDFSISVLGNSIDDWTFQRKRRFAEICCIVLEKCDVRCLEQVVEQGIVDKLVRVLDLDDYRIVGRLLTCLVRMIDTFWVGDIVCRELMKPEAVDVLENIVMEENGVGELVGIIMEKMKECKVEDDGVLVDREVVVGKRRVRRVKLRPERRRRHRQEEEEEEKVEPKRRMRLWVKPEVVREECE